MPRKNPPRTLPYEAHVAANVARERERHGMTYLGLANAMANAGCPIQPSALYKIEKGDPPRRITVNELWALGVCLKLNHPAELLEDPDMSTPPEFWRLVQHVEGHLRTIEEAQHHLEQLGAEMKDLVDREPRLRTVLKRALKEDWDNWPEVKNTFREALRPPTKKQGDQS